MFYKAYTMLLHTPNYMGEMQLISCITDESKTNSAVAFCQFRQRGDHLDVPALNYFTLCLLLKVWAVLAISENGLHLIFAFSFR